ncbi:MAG: Ig-like domain-containing protein [Eggerthellales bacterium]|nr:Ig-like domain-containing protein [Eggerthellales bacterium]
MKRRRRLLGKAAACAALAACLAGAAGAAFAASNSSPSAYSDLMNVKESKTVSTTNPYGYAQDVWFPLNTEHELMFNFSYNEAYRSANWFDTYKYGGGNPVAGGSYASSDTQLPKPASKFNLIEQVAFDPNGTGHKDHVAFVGYAVEGSNAKKLHIWVYDSVHNKLSGSQDLTEGGQALSWLGNGDFYRWANNYVALTAGDFDGDGEDTVVVYVPQPKQNATNQTFLKELYLEKSTGNFRKLNSGSALLNQEALRLANLNVSEDMALCVDLEAADLNGDGCDDLACVSTLAQTKGSSSTADITAYCSMLNVSYGSKSMSTGGIVGKSDGSMRLSDGGTLTDNKTSFKTMFDAALSAGDINNDGYDELVAAGWQTNVVSIEDSLDATSSTRSNSTNNTIGVMVINATEGKLFAETPYTPIQANKWTSEEIDDSDSYYPAMQMECVAINGKVDAEYIFINGTLYDNTFSMKLYEHDYFKSKDNGAGSLIINRGFITSVAVGNFDGNDVGREQVVYSIALKEKSSKDHTTLAGILYGTNYDDKTVDGETVHGVAGSYDGKHSGYVYENKGASWGQMQNIQLVAFDRDNDGAIARYKYTYTAYADPQVKAVLQASPCFGELGGYGVFDSGQTTYALSESYSITKGESDNISVGIGAAGEVEAPVVRVAVEIGYTGGYSKSWEKSYTTTWTDKFSANSRDTVVLSRTPIANYVYDVKAEDENGNLLSKEESLTVSAPGKPSYVQLNLDQYNQFVKEYNAQADSLNANPTGSASADAKAKAKITKLNPIDTSDPNSEMKYLGNEGNPWGYRSDWGTDQDSAVQVSQSLYTMNDAGGAITSNYAVETGKATTKTGTFGFEVGVTVQGGLNAAVASAWMGGYVNFAYDHEWSTTKSSTVGTETEGIVSNIDTDEAELSSDTTKAYGFQWSFGQWDFDASDNGKDDPIPVIGYALENIRSASLAPTSLSATAADVDKIELEWSIPTDDNRKRPAVAGFYVYEVVDDEYQLVKTIDDASARSVVIDGLDSNTEYEFAMSSYTTEYKYDPPARSDESKTTKATTFKKSYSLSYDAGKHATLSAKQLGSITVDNGESVPEQTMITGSVKAAEGYSITGLYIKSGNDAEKPLTLSSNGEFYFVLKADTVLRAETQKLVDEATVSLTQSDGGTISGYSEGIEFNGSGSTVTQEVTVEATPEAGKVLKSWIVTSTDSTGTITEEYEALGSNSLTFFVSRPSYNVQALFVDENDDSVTVSVKIDVTGQGSVSVTGNSKTYEPKSDGSYLVTKGDQLTVTAIPDANWVLSDWTGDLRDYTKADKEVSLRAMENVNAGVVFSAPVKYQVSYDTNIVNGGTVSCSTAASGDQKAKGSDHKIVAKAAEGYRLYQWTISQDGQEDVIVPVTELTTSAEYSLENLNANTTVTACFKEIEKFDLAVSASNCTVTVTRDGKTVDPGAQTLQYGDVVSISVADPGNDYECASFTVNDKDFQSDSTLTVYSNVDVQASYTKIPRFDLAVSASNCTVTVTRDGKTVDPGTEALKRDDVIAIQVQSDQDFAFSKFTVNGKDFQSGSTLTISEAVAIEASYVKIGLAGITVPASTYDYTGKTIAPKATVKDEAGNVVETAGYKLTYANNIKTGKATVTATGTGVYEGTVSTTFAIKDNTVANTNSMNASARTSVSSGKVSVTWGKVATATGYEVYVAQCSKGFSKKPTKTVSAKTQSLSFSKVAGKAISAKSIYKFKVKAYRMNGKTKIYLGTSLTCHAAGSRAIFTNVKAMTVAKKSISVSKGKTVKMPKIYTVKANVNKKLLPTDHAPLLRYWSTNTKIATVTSKGTIKGVGKGTCYVRAMAQNGKTVTVKITVK